MLRGFGPARVAGWSAVRIAIPIFDTLTALDAVGPYEVLSRLPGAEVGSWPQTPGPKRTENGMLALSADRSLGELPDPEVIVVPGGFGTRALMSDETMLTWLRAAHAGSQWTTSVCTGSLLLAAAGLLDGLRATTHWLELETLRAVRRRAGVRAGRRRQGKVITAAGVSSGIDMALTLAAAHRRRRDRPGDPARHRVRPAAAFCQRLGGTAPPEIVELVRARRSTLA